ncbi:uncharacterized protein [Rutidosis leptorrhynchoides]|uniref:uncharacterized protein n=1 Tax=Rutidosis leptorrhynchoides TaxID=125765 RepID=UPI003A9A1813
METLVVYAQQEQFNNSYTNGRRNHHDSFRDINCRTFQSGSGLLPNPVKPRSSPVTKHSLSNSSPKTPSSNNLKKHVSDQKIRRITKSKSVPLPLDVKQKSDGLNLNLMNDDYFYSELWAGPAYSNSPPPSSLPMPNFSIKPKRTVSLELPLVSVSDICLLTPKSAPPSPTRGHGYSKSFRKDLFKSDDDNDDEFATKTLRRILNLDD